MAGFCIDEASFVGVADLPLVVSRLNNQLSTIHEQHRQQVYRSSELDFVQVVNGVEFCELLYNETLELIDHDERILLLQTINRCIVWDAEDFEIPDGPVLFNATPSNSASILFVVTNALKGNSIGVISQAPPASTGVCKASVGGDNTTVFHVGLDESLERYYRFQMCFEEVSRVDFEQWVHLSFPRLRFALDVGSQLRRFRQSYEDIRKTIVEHLSAVNDDFLDLLATGLELSDVCDRVKASCGVVMSPESPNTHRNSSAMREREVQFRGERIVCEFHTKLTPTHDRIHFSPTIRAETDGALFIVVGPFADHLTV